MHRYLAGEDDRRRMLAAVGCSSVEELFVSDPRRGPLRRARPPAGAQRGGGAAGVLGARRERTSPPSARPASSGAGVYRHVTPAVADALLQRGEFFTAYTPYQPEVSQGTLQAIFEFQTFVCQLTGMEVANASLYDGATAVVEAVLMAHRARFPNRPQRRGGGLAPPRLPRGAGHLLRAAGPRRSSTVPAGTATGGSTPPRSQAPLGDDVCAVVVQSPNFFGVVEDLPALGAIAKARGRARRSTRSPRRPRSGCWRPAALRLRRRVRRGCRRSASRPRSAGRSSGSSPTRQAHLRQMPGRLVGETVDSDGRRGYVLTLSTREQHIRRAKATSNICTNHGLMALAATIVLSLLGKKGVREVALASHATAEYLKAGIRAQGAGTGSRLAFPDSADVQRVPRAARRPRRTAGPPEGRGDPRRRLDHAVRRGLPKGILVAATEHNTQAGVRPPARRAAEAGMSETRTSEANARG